MSDFKAYDEFGMPDFLPKEETILPAEKIDRTKLDAKPTTHKLNELVRDYYIFDLFPLMRVTNVDVDLVYQFAKDFKLNSIRVININAAIGLYNNTDIPFSLQGIPIQHKDLFRKYLLQSLFISNSKPRQYWRAYNKVCKISLPAVVAYPTDVDIWLPSGERARLDVSMRVDGTFDFVKMPPEQWIVDAALRYFTAVGVKGIVNG